MTGKELEADVPALARLVRVPAQGSFEELHEVERLDTHNVGKRKGEDFHEVVMPATDNRFAEQCEYVNLEVHQRKGEVHLITTGEDRGQPVTRPGDCQSKGSVIDPGKPGCLDTRNHQPYTPVMGPCPGAYSENGVTTVLFHIGPAKALDLYGQERRRRGPEARN